MSKPIQVILASGSKLFLEGVHKVLRDEAGVRIVAQVSKPEEVEKWVTRIKPDVLFLDNRMFDFSIHKLLDLINEKSPDTRVILFRDRIESGLKSLNVTFIDKEASSSELIEAVRRGRVEDNNQVREINDLTKYSLTEGEIRVVNLVLDGFSNKEIANKLSIKEKTVKTYLSSVFMKLGLQSRYQLMVYARKLRRR